MFSPTAVTSADGLWVAFWTGLTGGFCRHFVWCSCAGSRVEDCCAQSDKYLTVCLYEGVIFIDYYAFGSSSVRSK